jgi:hypothetical protein
VIEYSIGPVRSMWIARIGIVIRFTTSAGSPAQR